MERVTADGIDVERCTKCRGLWLDQMEQEKISRAGAESVDVGDAKQGHELSRDPQKLSCPACHTPMVRMVDVKQPHIWYEGCSVCGGTFFDAGELRDLKSRTLLDWLKSWRLHPRT